MLVVLGGIFLIAGVVLILAGRTNLPLGRLPGDIIYRGKNTTVYLPLATSIAVSIVLTILMYLIGKVRK
jgi:hypothetical protein